MPWEKDFALAASVLPYVTSHSSNEVSIYGSSHASFAHNVITHIRHFTTLVIKISIDTGYHKHFSSKGR